MVKFLGYAWTCFRDNGDLKKLILSLPRPYSEPLEKPLFSAFSGDSKEKCLLEAKKSIFKKLHKIIQFLNKILLPKSLTKICYQNP